MITKKFDLVLKKTIAFLFVLFFCNSFHISGQTNSSRLSTKRVDAVFMEPDIELEKNDVINNVLKVVNKSKETVNFSLNFATPANWKMLGSSGQLYVISPFD